jgi:hypothetical protein
LRGSTGIRAQTGAFIVDSGDGRLSTFKGGLGRWERRFLCFWERHRRGDDPERSQFE